MKKKTAAAVKFLDFTFDITKSTKDANGELFIEGYANTNSKDRVGDVVLPTAFAKSLPTYLTNPVLLANHDWNDPCGRCMSAEITEKGLYIKARLSDTRNDIKTLVREGVLSTFSIGYNEIDTDFDESTKTKYIKELELLEISIVTVPANVESIFKVTDTAAPEAAPAEEAAPKAASAAKPTTVKTAKQLAEFIGDVKVAMQKDLDGPQIIAVCEYFNTDGEEIMTKEQLIAALRGKSVEAPAAAAPASTPAAAAKTDAPAEAQPAAEGADADPMKQIMAKLDVIAQAIAQILEGAAKGDAPEEKPEEEQADATEKPEEEMSEEDAEKALNEINAEIQALEDSENA